MKQKPKPGNQKQRFRPFMSHTDAAQMKMVSVTPGGTPNSSPARLNRWGLFLPNSAQAAEWHYGWSSDVKGRIFSNTQQDNMAWNEKKKMQRSCMWAFISDESMKQFMTYQFYDIKQRRNTMTTLWHICCWCLKRTIQSIKSHLMHFCANVCLYSIFRVVFFFFLMSVSIFVFYLPSSAIVTELSSVTGGFLAKRHSGSCAVKVSTPGPSYQQRTAYESHRRRNNHDKLLLH